MKVKFFNPIDFGSINGLNNFFCNISKNIITNLEMLREFKLLLYNDNVNNICTLYTNTNCDFALWFNWQWFFNSFIFNFMFYLKSIFIELLPSILLKNELIAITHIDIRFSINSSKGNLV